jgi:hypothetical protein
MVSVDTTATESFDYAIIRVVPRVEREEFLNVGAIVFCRPKKYLAARVELDEQRLLAFYPSIDVETVQSHLEMIPRVCEGGEAAGPMGQFSQSERFNWIVAPKSTIVQCSPVHSGVCSAPEEQLDRLIEKMVRLRG